MGPKRDVLGQLRAAILAEGLHFGLSSHRAEHDWFFDVGRHIPSDVNNPANAALYGPAQERLAPKDDADLEEDFTYVGQSWLDDWLARTAELVTRYEPELVYFDWWVGQPAFRNTLPTDTSISDRSWGYIEHDTFKSPDVIIHTLADVVSKNGNLLLNVGPRADGSIPEEAQKLLREIGAWLEVNGEAVYGSKPWRTFGEGPTENAGGTFQEGHAKPYTAQDFRFTTHGGHLYAIELGWPENGQALIRSITPESKVRSVSLLGSARQVPFTQDADGLHLYLPKQRPGAYAWVYRIETN
jgi:alpha-L-fucosidase